MLKFNFSPSAIGLYWNSPLIFCYQYILKEKPDTEVCQVYGHSGTLVHDSLELYVKCKDRVKVNEFFIDGWEKYDLDNQLGLNGKPLSKMEYHQAMLYGMELIDKKYDIKATEMEIVLPFTDTINLKGFIDVVANYEGEPHIIDWKTSSSMDSDKTGAFRNQVLMYAHLYYRMKGLIINKAKVEYLKLRKAKEFTFTDEEIINYDKNVIVPIYHEILRLGTNPRNYELGDWDNPFNSHKAKCYQEKLVRDNVGAIQCYRENNRIVFVNGLDDNLRGFLDHYFSYLIEGRQFVDSYQNKSWDGRRTFLKKNSLPYSFVWKVHELLDVYNKRFGSTFWLNLIDKRDQAVVSAEYQTNFKNSDIKLRPYQLEAIESAMQKKNGIIYIGTGGGKSLLSAEMIKRVNKRTLFLVNRIELVRQTKEAFQNYLGVEVGEMSEGEMDITKQITVASIQTISAILKRKNEDSKKLAIYLYNVTCCISDEAQNVKDSGMYEQIANEMKNVDYMIGLSGSPFRSDNTTLDMNALVGFIIYRKDTKSLEDEGWILPTKTYFLSTPQNDGIESNNYHENYQTFITNNNLRNEITKNIVEKYKDSKKILILVKSIEHGEILEEMIEDSFFLHGSTKKKLRREMFEKFKYENGLIMISMVSIFSAGIDVCDLDMLINVSAFGSDIASIQSIGRTKRKAEGKKQGYFIDYSDEGIFQPMANKRKKILEEFGNSVETIHYTEWENMEIE